MAADVTGRCLCGRIRFRATPARQVIDCHCEHCRRFTGHHMAATGCDEADLHIDDPATLTWYAPSEHAEYGFCRECGSSLFWRGADRPGWVSICAGPLDPPTGLRTTQALFVAHASDYHTLDESIPGVAEE